MILANYESVGRRFESCRAHQQKYNYEEERGSSFFEITKGAFTVDGPFIVFVYEQLGKGLI
jgi:hypothetical protein